MKPDPHGCRADWEFELVCDARKRLHDLGECDGPGHCDYCNEKTAEVIKVRE